MRQGCDTEYPLAGLPISLVHGGYSLWPRRRSRETALYCSQSRDGVWRCGSRPSLFYDNPEYKRHPNNTKTDQLPISEVITGLPRPYHHSRSLALDMLTVRLGLWFLLVFCRLAMSILIDSAVELYSSSTEDEDVLGRSQDPGHFRILYVGRLYCSNRPKSWMAVGNLIPKKIVSPVCVN